MKNKELSDFEWQVLAAAGKIPLGQTRTYRWVAEQIGRPGAARAVGQALRKNPYAPVIPCHRVVKSDGTPGGYAGKYGPRKARLLEMERIIARRIKKAQRCRQSSNALANS